MATGLNYRDPATGNWLPSREEIDAFKGGAIARFGQHKVTFANNLNAANAITVQMANSQTLQSGILALSYYDTISRQSVVIAQIKDCQGQIVGSNEVLFADAFQGVSANVRYQYTKAGLEQDVVLLNQPPPPEKFGMHSTSAVLQVLTEFSSSPQPQIKTDAIPAQTDYLSDESLEFGAGGMKMIRGKAFLLGANSKSSAVSKKWTNVNGRAILVESVRFSAVAEQLGQLPNSSGADLKPTNGSSLYVVSTERLLPVRGPVKAEKAEMAQAKETPVSNGFVLDYVILNSVPNPYTFQGGTTYYVPGPLYVGTTTFEGGAIIKFAPNAGAKISCNGGITCNGGLYHPTIFTGRDDDSIGDVIQNSTGSPLGYYADTALELNGFGDLSVQSLRILYAETALRFIIDYDEDAFETVRDVQILHCSQGTDLENISEYQVNIDVENALIAYANTAFGGWGWAGQAQNVTVDHCTTLANDSCFCTYYDLDLYNCVVANVSHLDDCSMYVDGQNNGFYNSPTSDDCTSFWGPSFVTSTSPFQASANGNYYLAESSNFRGVGTTNGFIDRTLLAGLKAKTTHAPIALPTAMEVPGDITLFPEISRYTNGAPDLGYYYPALDYTVATVIVGGNLTVQPGTAIAVRNDFVPGQNGWTTVGFVMQQGSSIVSHGTPVLPMTFTSTKMVQEQPETDFAQYQNANGLPFSAVSFVPNYYPDQEDSEAPNLDFRFSNFYLPGADYHVWSGLNEDQSGYFSFDSSVYLNLRDCNLYGGRINLGAPYYTPGTDQYKDLVWAPGAISLFNNLFDRVNINLTPTFHWYNGVINCDMQVLAYNNLFRGSNWLILEPSPTTAGNWLFEDNLFDKTRIYQDTQEPLDYDYNAYWPLTPSELIGNGDAAELSPNTSANGLAGAHDITLNAAPPYRPGPLGSYYLPGGTLLYDSGSRSAADAGLAQYTTQTTQIKDSSQVDIGLHYVATASSGSAAPLDSDLDGVPDYIEDANGNGVVDANETNPNNPMTDGSTPDASSAIYDNIDLSGDGLVGRIKKALGMTPFDTSNPLMLTQVIGDNKNMITFEVPINYNVLMNAGQLKLGLDGRYVTLGAASEADDGNTLFTWNITYDTPGQHYLQPKYILNMGVDNTYLVDVDDSSDPDATGTGVREVLHAAGSIVPFYSANVVQFFKGDSMFDSNPAYLDAQSTESGASYSIDLYDPSTTPPTYLTTKTGSTSSDGVIQADWDVSVNGTPFTGDAVQAVFRLNSGGPSTNMLTRLSSREVLGQHDGFDFAYFYLLPQSGLEWAYGVYGAGYEGPILEGTKRAVDTLLAPAAWAFGSPNFYTSGFDYYDSQGGNPHGNGAYSGYPGYVGSSGDLNLLISDLTNPNGNVKNAYISAHGNVNILGTANGYQPALDILSDDIARRLNNNDLLTHNSTFLRTSNPFRFVFLDACRTAIGYGWSDAFGIFPFVTSSPAPRNTLGPQAFVGWGGDTTAWGMRYSFFRSLKQDESIEDAWSYAQTLADFYQEWQEDNDTLFSCLYNASVADSRHQDPLSVGKKRKFICESDGGPPGYQIFNFKNTVSYPAPIYVIGHSGLKRYGFNPTLDGYYPSPW